MATTHVPMWIDGQAVPDGDGGSIEVVNPATGGVIATVPAGGPQTVDHAVLAARRAFPAWRHLAPERRGAALRSIADELESKLEAVAQLLCAETGNAIRRQSRPEVQSAVSLLRYFAGGGGALAGSTDPIDPSVLNYTTREPLGVVGAMTPWNAPLQLAVVKVAAALITGNTVVLKASEEAPLAVLRFAEIAARYLPDGVLNVITGYGPEAGAALIGHSGIDKLSFTGSTDVGKLVMHAASERIVPVSLELGGKSPAIVFPDYPAGAAQGVVDGMRFPRQGQSCTAGTRVYVHEDVYETFLDEVVAVARTLQVGDPSDEATDIGSLINARQFQRVQGYLGELAQSGARFVLGDPPVDDAATVPNWLMRPTIVDSVSKSAHAANEEIFGPVMIVHRWNDIDEVVAEANNSRYGLAAYVWTSDATQALLTAARLEAGWVQVNRGLGQLPGMSYGGIKQSGLGREFSISGAVESFTYVKTTTIGLG